MWAADHSRSDGFFPGAPQMIRERLEQLSPEAKHQCWARMRWRSTACSNGGLACKQHMYRGMRPACGLILAIAMATVFAIPSLAIAQQHPAALGDLMTAFVQPRHIKLGLAGSEQNWRYAAYELDQLRETLADVAEILPQYRDLSIPEMITSTVKEPLAALDRAIKAEDLDQFTAAYGQLTASCNACHKQYDRTVIVIQAPTVSPFPDQDFRPH
jgi:hypothetical protein